MIKLCPSWLIRSEDGAEVPEDLDGMSLDRIFRRADSNLLDLFVKAGESKKTDGAIATDFVASTAIVDRMGDVIDQGTWRLANWRANPVILHEHAPPVIGKGKAKRSADALSIKVQWDIGDHNPIATLAGTQHLNGFRSAGSVGFIPGKAKNRLDLGDDDPRKAPKNTPRWLAGNVFSHNELLEFSSVAVPANPQALQLSLYADEAEGDEDKVERFVRESVAKATAEAILAAVKDDETIQRAIRALVWGEPASPKPGDVPLTTFFTEA